MHKKKSYFDDYSREDLLNELLKTRQKLSVGGEHERYLLEDTGTAMGLWSKDGTLIAFNKLAVEQMNSTSLEENVGKSIYEIFDKDVAKMYHNRIIAVMKSGKSAEFEDQVNIPSGSKWFSTVYKAVYDEAQKLIGVQIFSQDVTAQKEAEFRIRDQENRYKILFENMVQGAFYQNADGSLADANPAALDIFGLTREQFSKQNSNSPAWKVIDKGGNDLSGEKHPSMVALSSGQPVYDFAAGIYNQQKQDYVWVNINAIPVFKEGDKKPYQVFVTMHDITDVKKSEEAVQKNEEKLRNIVEHSSNLFYSHTCDHKLTYLSPQSRQYFDCDPEEAMRLWTDLATDNPINEIGFQNTVKAIDTGQAQPPYELELVGKKGRKIWVEVYEAPIVQNGKTVSIVGALVDITQRKKAQEALRRSEETYRKVVENAAEGIMVIQNDTIKFINTQMTKMTGYNLTDLMTKPGIELIHPDDREIVKTNNRLRMEDGDAPDVCSVRLATIKGDIRWVQIGGVKIDWEDGPAALLFVTDITDRVLMEEELANAEKLESLGVLAGGIAHDFNNILVAIMGNISLARMNLGEDSEANILLTDAEKATDRAKDLTQQLLTFAKGGQPVKIATDIKHIIRDAVSFSLRGTKVVCDVNMSEDLYPVEVDEGQLNQVFNNLIINAAQAMEEGGKIIISADNLVIRGESLLPLSPGKYLHIRVQDEGIGIPKEKLKKIFDPFYTTKDNGTGLGLASCYSIVSRHKGLITVNSSVGEGTTFHVYLTASEREVQINESPEEVAFKGSGKVLVLDDDTNVLTVTENILKRMGYTVEIAKEGGTALKMVREAVRSGEHYLMIICDLTIPGGKGGKEIISDVLKSDPDIIAIVSSGYSNDLLKTEFNDYGFSAFLSKPYKTTDVRKILNEVVRKSKKDKS